MISRQIVSPGAWGLHTGPKAVCVRAIALLAFLCPAALQAHIYRGMSTQVIIEPKSVTVTLRVAHQDMGLLSPDVDRDKDGLISADEFRLGQMKLVKDASSRFVLNDDGEPLPLADGEVEVTLTEGFTDKPHELKYDFVYKPRDGKPLGRLHVDPNIFRDVSGLSPITGKPIQGLQKNTVTILDRGRRVMLQATGRKTDFYETVVSAPGAAGAQGDGASSVTQTAAAASAEGGPASVAAADAGTVGRGTSTGDLLLYFLKEGVYHILFGWDHIFFVLGLALAARNAMALLKVITAFTLAHSVTLVLSSLNIIDIPYPAVVEAVVAVSIAYVGLDNLIRIDKEIRWRWAFVFGFGLLHGLTFAGSLRELLAEHLGGGRGIVVGCLLIFNLGVELGQLMILAALYPLLQFLRQHRPVIARRVIIAGSGLVLFMGASFFLDRTFATDLLPWLTPFK